MDYRHPFCNPGFILLPYEKNDPAAGNRTILLGLMGLVTFVIPAAVASEAGSAALLPTISKSSMAAW